MDKFDVTRNSTFHMRMFINTLAPYQLGEDTLVKLVRRYLTKVALLWDYHEDSTK